MDDPRNRRRVLIGGGVVALVAVLAYLPYLGDQPWFIDESAYVAQTYYYHLLFHQGDPWHEDWQQRGGIEVAPVPKYLFGLAMDVAGLEVPTTYESAFYWYREVRQPPSDPRVLPVTRPVSAVAGTIACLALYALAVRAWGPIAGTVAGLLWCVNPLVRMSSRRAMGDAITECLVLLTVVLGAAVCRRLLSPRVGWVRTGLLAALLALTGSLAANAKLNGAVGLLSVALMLVVTWGWLVRRYLAVSSRGDTLNPSASRLWGVTALSVGTPALAFGLFCLTNPFLWGGGQGATVFSQATALVEHRDTFARSTRVIFHRRHGSGLFTPWDKVQAVCHRGFGTFATLHPMLPDEMVSFSDSRTRSDWSRRHPILTGAVVAPVSALLTLVGLVLIGARLRAVPVAQILVTGMPWLAYLAVTTTSVVWFINLDWDRYYVPLLAPWSVPMGVALATGAAWVLARTRRTDKAA